jgi:hypothetical protein
MSTAQFKTLIDGLYAIIVSGKTTCLTLAGARRCILGPTANPGGVMYGNLDVAAVPTDSNYMNCGAHYALEAEASDANALHSWTGVNHVVYDGTAGYGDMTFRVAPKVGHHYIILFDFKTRAAAAGQQFSAQSAMYPDRSDGVTFTQDATILYTPASDDNWQQGALPFYMDNAFRIFRTYLFNNSWTNTKGCKFGNFRLVQIS